MLTGGMLGMLALAASDALAQAPQANPYASEQRIILDGSINQKPARFLFDTGASFTALFTAPATRLGLPSETNRTIKIAGHDVSVGLTRPVEIILLGKDANTRLPILPFPSPAECDGVFGWRTLGDSPFYIDAPGRRIRPLTALPANGWQRWTLDMDSTQLFFEATSDGKSMGRVFVDTGSSIGLRISPQLWQEWRKQNPQAGITLTTYRYAVGEPMVHELAWAKEYRLGDLLFHDVDIGPIPEAKDGKAIGTDGKEFNATIGMSALKHLRMIVNRSTKEVLTQSFSPVPEHNRLGAVFSSTTTDVSLRIARILKDTPADKAGLHEGDVLLAINGTDISSGTTNPEPFLMQPAGTRLVLKVKRDQTVREFTVVLQNLLP